MSENPSLPETNTPVPPKKSNACCLAAGIILVCLFLLCGGGCVLLFSGAELVISEETTYITEPLTADGQSVDYFAAIELKCYPENMKTDDNGYRLIVKNLGVLPDDTYSEERTAQILEKLGLDAGDIRQPRLKFQDPQDFLKDYVASEEFDATLIEQLAPEDPADEAHGGGMLEINPLDLLRTKLNTPWTLDDLPMMAEWLEENGPALDLIGQAVAKPSFCVPMTRTVETQQLLTVLLDGVQQTRSLARALSARAHYRVATGDIDGAIEDILACKRLGRQVGQGGFMVEGLVGISIEGIAGSIPVAGWLESQPTEAQLQRLSDGWEDAPGRTDVEETMLSERYITLDIVQGMAHGTYSQDEFFDAVPLATKGFMVDWNVVARRANEHFDNLEEGIAPVRPNTLTPKMLFPSHRSRAIADLLAYFFLPAADPFREAHRRLECCDNLHQIALAMLIHERQHGSLPGAFTVDTEGAPLHSWRVILLPYLGQQELYDQIRLDEPWDSQHNRQFHNEAISFYQCPSAELDPGQTTYSVVVGPDMPFAAAEGKLLADFGPQSADMILVVERAEPVCWMDPTQEVPQPLAEEGTNVNLNGIASQHPGGANFGHRDGAVRFLAVTLDIETFKKLLEGTNDNRDY